MEKFYQKTWFIILIALALITFTGCTDASASVAGSENNSSGITSLSMQSTEEETLHVGKLNYSSWVNVEPSRFDPNNVDFFVMHDDIATVEKSTDTAGALWFKVIPKKPGITGVYAETKDGVKSEVVKITVLE